MKVEAKLRFLHMSPKKVRLVANLIKKLSVKKAELQLKYSPQRSARSLEKLLKSAVANAENNFHLSKNNLFISGIRVDEGPALKRWRPRSRGVAYPIKKRSSHIYITLSEINPTEKPINPVQKETKKKEKVEKIQQDQGAEESIEKERRYLSEQKVSRSKIIEKENRKGKSTLINKPKIFRRKAF